MGQEDLDSVLSEQDDKDENDGKSIICSALAACNKLSSVTGRLNTVRDKGNLCQDKLNS